MSFTGPRDVVLAQSEAEALGFRTATGWQRATRVLDKRRDGQALVLTLATSDPLGRRIEARLEPAGEGVIRLSARPSEAAGVEAVGIGFKAEEGERYLGFGERSNAVDQRGGEVETYVSEGPFQREERSFVFGFVPPWGYHPRDDAAYFAMPWLVSTRGYGVLVDNTEPSWHRLAQSDSWSVDVEAPELRLRVFAGPQPADVVRRLTAEVGRQPPPAAAFYFGAWFQPSGDERAQTEKLVEADAPLSLAQTYLHYLPCGDQRGGGRERQRERTAWFHERGMAITTYFNPMICVDYSEAYDRAAAEGALTQNAAGQPYVYRYNEFVVSQVDFSAESGVRLYHDLLREAVEDGFDGWMEDFGEYTPLDSRSANGMSGREMHNLYPVQYHCAAHAFARDTPRPLARYIRSGYTGVHPCAQIVWNGDPTTDWGFDGLRSAIWNGLGMGMSGISTWGSDVGGFFGLGFRDLTPELLIRWIQFGAVSPVMRTQANGFHVPEEERPQVWDDEILPHWRRWAKLHTQLFPYIAAADHEYQRTGLPIMRHLALAYPADPTAVARDDDFMFGPDLLAAPVFEPGAETRRVYLPRGRWVDLWRAVRFRERDGAHVLGRARTLRGGQEAELPAPLGELPLLARAGAVIPMLAPDVDTLSRYGEGGPQVRLSERRRRLHLLAFPRGASRARFERGGHLLSRERRSGWVLRVRGPHRRYRVQASLATLRRPFRPCAVEVDGRPVRFRYNRSTRVLRVRFSARSSRLLARKRC